MQTNRFRRLKIWGWRQFQSIEIELHPTLTIITGANGAGKSTILSFFTRHFGYNRSYLATPYTKGGILSFTFGLFDSFRKGLGLSKPTPQGVQIGEIEYDAGPVSVLRLPQSQQLHYSIQIENQRDVAGIHIDSHRPPNIYRHVGSFPATPPSAAGIGNTLNSEYINYYANGQVQNGSLHHIKMTLIQMSIFGYGNNTMEPIPKLITLFTGFEEKLRILLPKSLGFKKLIIRSPEVLLSTTTGDFLIDAASGGVIKLFEIAWQIYFYSQDHERFVVTFDEPENHLHPSMQKSFLPNIVAAFPNIQIIAVTHSPFIISAMQDSAVYVLRYADTEIVTSETGDDESIRGLMGSRVSAERLDTVNKAGSASEILREVLGITTTIPDWAEVRVGQIIGEYKGSALNEDLLKRLYAQLEKEGLASSYPAAVTSLSRPA
jgi:hypothetical protein